MRVFFFIFCLFFSNFTYSNSFYFSSLGDDDRSIAQAQNPSTPWRSINKLNSIISTLNPGDSVLFRCTDIFSGHIIVATSGSKSNPIVFSSYGSGNKPVITGFVTLSQWLKVRSNVYEATSFSLPANISTVLINGIPQRIGRYPNSNAANKGYLTFETSTGRTQIRDKELTSYPNWTNGEVVIRKNRWVIDRNFIRNHRGNAIDYISESNYSADPNFGYFIQNHPETLDQEGEWYFNKDEKKLGLYFSSSPTTRIVKASAISTLVTVINQHNVLFSDLSFEGANENTFDINRASGIRIKNCDIRFSGVNAVNATNSQDVVIENSVIRYTNNNALNMGNCSNATIKNNQISCTGIIVGMGKGNSGSYEAIMIEGNNNLVEFNSIDSTGYIPITFSGNDVTIKNNFINEFAYVKDDGGGIYTYNGSAVPRISNNRKIIGNIVLNGRGAGEGTSHTESRHANGIYMDDKVNNVEISGNTVANCSNYGLFLHNTNNIVIKKNNLFNNAKQMGMSHDKIAPNNPIRDVNLASNVFFSKNANDVVAEFKTIKDDIRSFGRFNENYYSRPVDESAIINTSFIKNGVYQNKANTLAGWKELSDNDQLSKNSPISLPSYKVKKLIGDSKFTNGSFNNNTAGLYIWSAARNSSIAWDNNKLDGGALKIQFSKLTGTTNRASVIINVGSVSASKTYIFKFSSKSTNENKLLQVYLRQSEGGYKDISTRKDVILTAARKENEIMFKPTISESNASIVLDVEEQKEPVYLDNIQLVEAEVSPVDPDDVILFEYNRTTTTKSVSLDGTYIDVANKKYIGAVSLAPYSSIILLKNEGGKEEEEEESPPPMCSATGYILHEHWDNIAGNNISNIPVEKKIERTRKISSLEISNQGDNYATRIRGYICPPQTGEYTFFIAGDDAAELWLSNSDQPAEKRKIASLLSWTNPREWNKFASQKSATIHLAKGSRYYIEVLHKQGGGGDHLSVAWKLPGGQIEAPISGSYLSPFIGSPAVTKKHQTINFASIANKTFGDDPFILRATSSSGLPVSFKIVAGPAELIADKLVLTGAGIVKVEASQVGDENFNAAAVVRQSFTIAAAPEANCSATGFILQERWENVGGNTVAAVPVGQPVTRTRKLSSIEINNLGDNYATRIRGYVCAPETGNYIFFIAGDDAAELWLSTTDQPSQKVRIAKFLSWTNVREWNKFASQRSAAIKLIKGNRYYLEVLHKEGAGGDNLSVAWQLPSGFMEAPIAGAHLSPFEADFALKRQSLKAALGETLVEELNDKQLKVYPNPANEFAWAEYIPAATEEIELSIADAEGKLVKKLPKVAVVKNKVVTIRIPASGLGAGMYFLRLHSLTGTYTEKLVIKK